MVTCHKYPLVWDRQTPTHLPVFSLYYAPSADLAKIFTEPFLAAPEMPSPYCPQISTIFEHPFAAFCSISLFTKTLLLFDCFRFFVVDSSIQNRENSNARAFVVSRFHFGCWFAARAPVAFWHVVNYDVQPISRNADVLEGFRDTFDELCLLLLSSSLPHLNNYYWHDITSNSFLNG